MLMLPSVFCCDAMQIDEVINQAQATRSVLGSQRALFGDVGGKVKVLSEKFPVIRGLLGIRSFYNSMLFLVSNIHLKKSQ